MLLAPAALELSDQVQTLGAYAGFASIVGLAVLSLLYFGQARELRRLREWAGRAPERAAELQERVEAEATVAASVQKRVVAQPARPAPGVQPSTAAGAAAVGAASTSPTGATGPAPAVPAVPAANPGAPGALTVPSATQGKPAEGTDQPTVVVPGATPLSGAGAGATPVSGVTPKPPTTPPPTGGGTGELTLPPSTPAGVGAAAGSTQDSGETAVPLRRVSAASASPGSARAAGAPPSPPKKDPAGRGGPLAIVGGLIVVLLVGVLVATQLLGGDDGPPPRENTIETVSTTDTPPDDSEDKPKESTNTSTTPEVQRGGVTVAVLNGTLTTGLAKGASDKVAAAGYRIGKITNANDQSRTSTTVQFAEGSRQAAEDVAQLIGVSASAVSALDPGTRVVAGEDAAVVVTVGADQDK